MVPAVKPRSLFQFELVGISRLTGANQSQLAFYQLCSQVREAPLGKGAMLWQHRVQVQQRDLLSAIIPGVRRETHELARAA